MQSADDSVIVIFEWCRPQYLAVTLDAIHRAQQPWPILVSIDGPEFTTQFRHLMPRVSSFIVWPQHVGNLWHTVRSLECAISHGYKKIMFIDGDMLVRRDTFVALGDIPTGATFRSLQKGSGELTKWFSPLGNVASSESLKPVLEYTRSNRWVGEIRPGFETKLEWNHAGYDAVFCRHAMDGNAYSVGSERSFVGHFGVDGVDNHGGDAISSRMFSGNQSDHIENVIREFNPIKHKAFVPHDFIYA